MFACLLFSFPLATSAWAQGPIADVKTDVRFDQQLGSQVPADLVFRDELGTSVKLGDYFGTRPIILTLNYFHCPNVCSFALDQLTGALADIPFNLGDEYSVVTVSIDPRETPELAGEKKWQYIRSYARPERGEAWHFLTGEKSQIDQLAQAVGFHYAYDAATDEFAHPIGLIVLTPGGQVARYIFGTDFEPHDVRLALVEASENKIASPIDQLLLLCYHYDPANGRYSSIILDATRIAGIATVLALGVFLGRLWRADLKRKA